MTGTGSLDQMRAVADAVLYEGYLLYPYRASSSKNRSRWQFGVLGPPRASAASFAEEPGLSFQCLVEPVGDGAVVAAHLRCLQIQVRTVEERVGHQHHPVPALAVGDRTLLSWEEAVECEIALPAFPLAEALAGRLPSGHRTPVEIPGGRDVEPVLDDAGSPVGRIVRTRLPLRAEVEIGAEPDDGLARVTVSVRNTLAEEVDGKDAAVRRSLIGTHVLMVVEGGRFLSLVDPPADAVAAAGRCSHHRCFPVLAGPRGSSGLLLGSPIILYDHPEIAEQSAGALFDSTEIDEILTLRVMTMTEAEKAEARATDPRAAEIVDRCEQMSPETLRDLHGVLRLPSDDDPASDLGGRRDVEALDTAGVPWWDPTADADVRPDQDAVVIDGVRVAKGSLVRVHPSRRADAQDLFFAGRVARVSAVLADVDGGTHVALVLVDDPAADLHDWYGRYLYFAPDELEPLDQAREESHP